MGYPWDFPLKTHAIPRSDEKSITFHLSMYSVESLQDCTLYSTSIFLLDSYWQDKLLLEQVQYKNPKADSLVHSYKFVGK